MDYIELSLELKDETFAEILEAELTELPFESFDRQRNMLKAYMPINDFSEDSIEEILASYSEAIVSKSHQKLEHQNWNKVWESSYEPVVIPGKLFVGATFHETPKDGSLTITLDPNMSFGTGHHPTTNMILKWMLEQKLEDVSVFDFGAGSGVLSVLASMMGAYGEGIEIDEHAAAAANHNLVLNNVDNFTIHAGDLNPTKEPTFDLILANINRNIILERLQVLNAMLRPGGRIACSGFLEEDGDAMRTQLSAIGWTLEAKQLQDGWLMMVFKQST